jgi:LPS-assembly protein
MRVFCCQSRASRVPIHVSGVCYAEPYTVPGLRMRSRYLVCITLLAVCHPSVRAQAAPLLINAAPLAKKRSSSTAGASHTAPAALSNQKSSAAQEGAEKGGMPGGSGEEHPSGTIARTDSTSGVNGLKPMSPGNESSSAASQNTNQLPIAVPEPQPSTGVPVQIEALTQTRAGELWTLAGNVVIHYRGYVIRAGKITYDQTTSEMQAEGQLEITGGPYDVLIRASHGEMNLKDHTGHFYNVTGSEGVRTIGRNIVYSTPTPLLFTGRELIENGEGNFRVVDGSITNCRLPHPDWRVVASSIRLNDGRASTSNARFELLGVPVFYFPWLVHAARPSTRQSGLLIPVVSTGSSIRGYTFGEQVYWAINRSMDAELGTEYFSKRGWAPNGNFRYKGFGLDHATVRFNSLFDRGIDQPVTSPGQNTPAFTHVNQGGVDMSADFRKDFSAQTRIAGTAEYLSSYVYRLIFNDNYSQATSSQISSVVALTHNHNGIIPSGSLQRFQNFASAANGDEAKILHLPSIRYDVVARPLGNSPFHWRLGSSAGYLTRSEPNFHSRNVGRLDVYPHLSLPLSAGGWNITPEAALRDTYYTISEAPDFTGANNGVPTISHDPVNRTDVEASLDIRPPALERDFNLPFWHRRLRHVIEPEINYRFVGGIGAAARNVLLFDTTDIATNTNQVGYSLTQHFYVSPSSAHPCPADAAEAAVTDATAETETGEFEPEPTSSTTCQSREWASWQIMQDLYIDSSFGGAVIPGRRNVFASTLDLSPVAFLTGPRNLSPIVSRMRFNAIPNLRAEWDLDYDPRLGQLDADNLYAGYSFGRTTVGVTHSLLNAVDENTGTSSTTLKSQLLHPFLSIGKPTGTGFSLAANGGYDFVLHQVQYAGVQSVYNWNCCGISLGYRRFELGSGTAARDETQWLYGFTFANFGAVGDLRHGNSIFRDATLPPNY